MGQKMCIMCPKLYNKQLAEPEANPGSQGLESVLFNPKAVLPLQDLFIKEINIFKTDRLSMLLEKEKITCYVTQAFSRK